MQGHVQSGIQALGAHLSCGGGCVCVCAHVRDLCLRLLGDASSKGSPRKEGREEGAGMWMEQQTTKTSL